MVELSSSGSHPPTLPLRPPTPPRESSRNEAKPGILQRLFFGDSAKKNPTSNITPDSSAESRASSPNTSIRKKVGWSELTEYNEAPQSAPVLLPPLPPSAERKPTKSILKVQNGLMERDLNVGARLLPPHQHASFAAMLESIVQQLAGNERGAKIDAYLMLAGSLKASANIPDPKALKEKMGLLLQFILRDVAQKTEAGKADSPLVMNSLILLSSFLQLPTFEETINQEFATSIVEHAIKTFEDPQMSKDIVKHLMFVLAQQKFSPRTMNTDRIDRLIAALHAIESLIQGKSVVMGKLNIYRTLFRQSRPHMIANTIWLEDLLIDMVSSVKEIRTLAVTCGLEASFSLGGERQFSQAAADLFENIEVAEVNFAQFYAGRLRAILAKKQDMACVPHIWSILMLCFRGKPQLISKWPYAHLYLEIFQECLNSSDYHIRIEANYAWNRFVYAVQPTEKTSSSVIKMLLQPLLGQLKTRKSSNTRKSTLGSVCNLLYYTLKPTSTSDQLNFFWDTYLVPLVSQALNPVSFMENPEIARRDLLDGCSIVRHLFDSSFQRPWNESRAMVNYQQNNVLPKELPALEPKWIRKNSSRVFPVLVPIMEKLFWDLAQEAEVTLLWQTYIYAISAPAVMEVTVNNDTMASMASILGLLHRIWRTGPGNIAAIPLKETSGTIDFLNSFNRLITTTIKGLGIRPFTQRHLCIGTEATFTPVATPSGRPNKLKGEVRTPLQHLLCLLASISPGLHYDSKFYHLARSVLGPFFAVENTNRSRSIDLAKGLLLLLPAESTSCSKLLWKVIADFVATAVDTRDNQRSTDSLYQPIGTDYRNVVQILDTGFNLSPSETVSGWKVLFEALVTAAALDAGVAGKAISVVEPLAKCFVQMSHKSTPSSPINGLSYYHLLLAKAEYPKDRHALEAAKKRIWGVGSGNSKPASFDPYVHLYEYIHRTLTTVFQSYSKMYILEYSDMLVSTTALIAACPSGLLLEALVMIQDGLSLWVLDAGKVLNGGNVLSDQITATWDAICSSVPRLEEKYGCTKILSDLEPLICSGLESSHKAIASRTIRMWNTTFGISEEAFEYPERVQAALLRLRTIAEVQLPFIAESTLTESLIDQAQAAIEFAETQDDSSSFLPTTSMASILNKHRMPHERSSAELHSSPGARKCRETTPEVVMTIYPSTGRKRPRDACLKSSKRKSLKQQSTPKLRHDDSQVQFQTIESSPVFGGTAKSQLLTDRQREVKERQLAHAAIFPDLKSSPRRRSVPCEITNEPELPLHKSSSKTGNGSQPLQTTPTPLPQSEDDGFVPSSPTPKRRSERPIDLSAPPSSPPDLPAPEQILDIEITPIDEADVPSSSPQTAAEPDQKSKSFTEYPSAQPDPFQIPNATISAYDRTDFINDPNQMANYTQGSVHSSVHNPTPVSGGEFEKTGGNTVAVSPPRMVSLSFPPPSTPTNKRAPAASRAASPSPPFLDALTSPRVSDKNTVNEDVFEDAVTSPRLIMDRSRERPPSPSGTDLSDSSFNDSSFMRMVEELDERPGQVMATSKPVLVIANLRRSLRASSRLSSQEMPTNTQSKSSMRKAAMKNAASFKIAEGQVEPNSQSPKALASPIPSIVPETPATKPPVVPDRVVPVVENLDPSDTIVVDASILELPVSPSGVRKRKLHEASREVTDVQGQEHESPNNRSLNKRRKGRSKPSSRSASQATESSQEVAEQSQSMVLPDVKTSSQTSAAFYGAAQIPAASTKKNIDANTDVWLSTFDPDPDLEPQTPISDAAFHPPAIEQSFDASRGHWTSPHREVGETTMVGEADCFPEKPLGYPEKVEAEERVMSVESMVTRAANEAVEERGQIVDKLPDIQFSQGVVPASTAPLAPTYDAVKEKMEILIKELGVASFSRTQLAGLEDMFVDAKEMLYGAARRGRQVGL